MAIVDTTNVLDNSIFLKAKLDKNMVGTNYYIENLQNRRNQDWEMRYNRVDIEEELNKQNNYTEEIPTYTPIESVITNVKSDKGEDLGADWAHLAFKDLKHPNNIGMRYRFSLDFPDMAAMSEEEKYFNTSIWIAVNKAPIKAGNSCTVRRCDTALAMVGSPSRTYEDITEVHYEPCVLDNDLKYMQVYYNLTAPIPQAEWYATLQCNYFSNQIKINDRFLFGTIDSEVRENNSAYKVKAVIKASTTHTFVKGQQDEMESTPLIVLALDKDLIGPDDDLDNRIAFQCPIYKVNGINPRYDDGSSDDGRYTINYITNEDVSSKKFNTIRMGNSKTYTLGLYHDGNIFNEKVNFEFDSPVLEYVDPGWYNDYFEFNIEDNSFTIKCKDSCEDGDLIVSAYCLVPGTTIALKRECKFKLKGL